MKPRRNLFLGSLLVVATVISLATVTHAANLTWDADTLTTGAQDGGGTWTAGGAGWWNGTTTANANWTNGDVATFGSGSGTAGTHAITLGSDVSVGTLGSTAGNVLLFNTPGNYTISAASAQTIQLNSSGTATGYLRLGSGVTATIGNNVTLRRLSSVTNGQMNIYGGATAGQTNGGKLVIGTGVDGANAVFENLATNLNEMREGATVEVKKGGTFTSTGSFVIGGTLSADNNFTNTLHINGGTFNVSAVAGSGNHNLVIGNTVTGNADGNTAIVTLSAGALNINPKGTAPSSANGLRFGTFSSSSTFATNIVNATFNLDGGVVTVGRIYDAGGVGTINSTFNFNGGELKVLTGTNNAAVFMTGLDTAQVRNGGAKIHTNGVDTTIGQALVHSTITTPTPDNAIDGGLEKRGAGKLTLTNTNTYTGNTTVTEGTLALSGSGSINDSAVIDVQTGASLSIAGVTTSTSIGGGATDQTLKGLGSVDLGSKTLTVGSNGTLAPGNSPGTLEFTASTGGKLDFSSGSIISFELGTTSDLIAFNSAGDAGDWLSGSGNATLSLSLLAGFSYANTYTVFDNVSTAGFTLANITGYNTAAYTANFAQSGTDYTLSFAPIPEPRAALLGGLGMLALLRRRRVGK